MMTSDKRKAATEDKFVGQVKEAEGKATGDTTQELQGKAKILKGKAKEKLADVEDAVEEVADKIVETFDHPEQ